MYFRGAATAVENQLSEMNAIKERSQAEKQRWLSTISAAYREITVRVVCCNALVSALSLAWLCSGAAVS